MARIPKPKAVAYELIGEDEEVGQPMYVMLRELIAEHHTELNDARIALAWCLSWKPDCDGRVTLGKCRKASDLDRELMAYDFVILLRRQFWTDLAVNSLQRRALLDHELCHATVKLDKFMEPVLDSRGRKVWRIRKHDIEEFGAIAERYGCYKRDLERFAASLRRAPSQPTFDVKADLLNKAVLHDCQVAFTEGDLCVRYGIPHAPRLHKQRAGIRVASGPNPRVGRKRQR